MAIVSVTVISEERVMCEIPNGKPVDVEVTGFGSTSLPNASKFTRPPKVLKTTSWEIYGNTNLTLLETTRQQVYENFRHC